jgi:hypothetical protein
MRVPHRELERFRRDPRGWLARQRQKPPFKGMRIRNELALRMAVHHLHKGHSADEAAVKLRYYARKDVDVEGRREVLQRLAAYVRWYSNSGRDASHSKFNFPSWDDGELVLGGYVDRIDLVLGDAQPMQGIFLGSYRPRWSEELRMPLAQHALATFHSWPVDEVAIGVQLIDGSPPELSHYSEEELAQAIAEFEDLRGRAGV